MQSNGKRETPDTDIQPYEYVVALATQAAVPLPWEVIEPGGRRDPLTIEDASAQEPVQPETIAEIEIDPAEEARLNFEAGRTQGIDEGRSAEREAFGATHAAVMARMADAVSRLMENFEAERNRYLQGVERESVKLALAVAARVLRREAQMDPLLLLGAVRVALGQLSDSTQVRLRVPPTDLKLWSEAVALLPDRILRPQIVAGESMRLGDCAMETELGTVDLGVRAQMAEIERGFFDRASAGMGSSFTVEPAA